MTDYPIHPLLPCGYNSWENNGDEINGAGANEPIWPELFDTFHAIPVMVLTPEMMAGFADCPDIVIPAPNKVIMIPGETTTLMVRGPR